MANEKIVCSIDGCEAKIEKEEALLPPLKVLAEHLKRRVRLEDLESHAVCRACARAFVSVAEEEARKSGRSVGQLFHPFYASVALIQNLEHKREVEEEKRLAEEEARKTRVVTSLGTMFGDTFAKLRESAPDAEVLEHPTAKTTDKKVKAESPRRRSIKKAAG